ncbi:helix-turn-helix domain-containing protein [Spirosoma validum]|uniref:Helix-turn-helix transcriptional regulator n=1 Tax=Spirosoma validum TaxID=2771355 RepID=A0A927B5I7_9BACT|nr:AraC family transcriptional regulator [Spirosoma validum]MBD2755627.1 helix-turn-helix transcriptional regulator [Spirosoma validum]
MAIADIEYKLAQPDPALSDFVESFWMLVNHTDEEKDVVVLPDGRFDIFFSCSAIEPFHVTVSGLANEPSQSAISPQSVIFAISFKLLALEYLLDFTIAPLANKVSYLPTGFWNITPDNLTDFSTFCDKVSAKMMSLLKGKVNERKQKLMELIYSSQGALPVHELSDSVHWSSRQINRYFQHWFGVSLKTYCGILRYRASFDQIREGKLFPDQNFTDQAHFIKDVKKYSGVTPKELTRNENDRFIQFSTLSTK